jgi:hypothetical protein
MFNAAILNMVTSSQETGRSVNYRGLEDGFLAMEDLAFALAGKKGNLPFPTRRALPGRRPPSTPERRRAAR